VRSHDCGVLFGDMVITHTLVSELGERRVNTLLAMLENPDLQLTPSDRHAFEQFLARLESHFGSELPAVRQLRVLSGPADGCPE